MKKIVRTFTLPNEEYQLNEFINKEGIDVMNTTITPCPKEGIILYLVECEDHSEE